MEKGDSHDRFFFEIGGISLKLWELFFAFMHICQAELRKIKKNHSGFSPTMAKIPPGTSNSKELQCFFGGSNIHIVRVGEFVAERKGKSFYQGTLEAWNTQEIKG